MAGIDEKHSLLSVNFVTVLPMTMLWVVAARAKMSLSLKDNHECIKKMILYH